MRTDRATISASHRVVAGVNRKSTGFAAAGRCLRKTRVRLGIADLSFGASAARNHIAAQVTDLTTCSLGIGTGTRGTTG